MRTRVHGEDGFLLIELMAAMVILTIALLALIGAYSLGYFALNSAGESSSAGLLANNQLQLYASLPYDSVGLDSAALSSAQANDATYVTDEKKLPVSGTDVTISGCGSSPQCSPVQTLTGGDHKTYKVETFIRLLPNPNFPGRMEKVITVLVRDPRVSGSPIVAQFQTARDVGT